MNAQQYFQVMVVPTYKEHERNRSDTRRALLASLVLFHMLDYLNADSNGNSGKLGNLQEATCKRCAAFNGIRALTNAAKHVQMQSNRFSVDHIQEHFKDAVIDRRATAQNATREFRTVRPMLWFELDDRKQGKQMHFVDVDLFVALHYLAREYGLPLPNDIEDPMRVTFADHCSEFRGET